ncbi:TrbC/VirB2 family protein [Rickettsia endosymbiont of Halotydeus destructor]|uniref:TrbC/VirB2 family protein n=1 Tax=Rickettsia endosymbiont of Halotydeus destructor TaxID=2996754 RepID=UPI003BAF8926
MSWTISLMVVTGIIITYQAPNIVSMIYGEKVSRLCTTYGYMRGGTWDTIGGELCRVLKLFSSTTMRAIALVGVIVLGIQALKGTLSWTIALMSILGIILMFSAPAIYILVLLEKMITN